MTEPRLLLVMNFAWDLDKQRTNRRKHGIELADAVAVFQD